MNYAEWFRTQPAPLVRGSSRRIMSLRFRPAYISVINRRASSWAVIGPAVHCRKLKAHPRERVPAEAAHRRSIVMPERCSQARVRFAAPTPARPCLLRAVPARPLCDGRLRREHFAVFWSKLKKGVDRSLHISSLRVRAWVRVCCPIRHIHREIAVSGELRLTCRKGSGTAFEGL